MITVDDLITQLEEIKRVYGGDTKVEVTLAEYYVGDTSTGERVVIENLTGENRVVFTYKL